MHTRRDFLKLAAKLSGAAAASELVPEAVRRAYAISPDPGSTWLDAEHIVILMQENRAFDHMFGTLRGVRGFNDPRALRLANGNTVFVQTDGEGQSWAPWRLNIRDTRITWMGSIPHTRHSQVDAWNEGRHDDWIDAKRSYNKEYAHVPMTMGHYTREDLPFYYALADAFTVCDQHYCGIMSCTTPNRSSFWTGTVREKQHSDSSAFLRNEQYLSGKMKWMTYPERLQAAGVSWKCYQNDVMNAGLPPEKDKWLGNYGDNLLEYFAAYNIQSYSGFAEQQHLQIEYFTRQAAKLENEITKARDADQVSQLKAYLGYTRSMIAESRSALAQSGEARRRNLTPLEKILFDAAFVTNAGDPDYHKLASLSFTEGGKQRTMKVPAGDLFHQFRQDVEAGTLPTVSWLVAPQNFCDHPSSPWYGAWYVSEAMDILTKNPEVWKKTIFILTYDENDGYFDHAPSFVAADPKRPWTGGASDGIDTDLEYTHKKDEIAQGIPEKIARTGPIGMGFRVPLIIASPWSRGGWVNSQLFDHTSTLMFLEQYVAQRLGKTVAEENISAWRRATSGNLTSVFRRFDPRESRLDLVDRDEFVVGIEKARYKQVPSNYKTLSADDIASINHSQSDSKLMPRQETGVRPACGLPYELYAEAGLTPDGEALVLRMAAGDRMHGKQAVGAPFNVYLRNLKPGTEGEADGVRAATFAVRAGDALTRQFPLELFRDLAYEVDVHGPNGFYRNFRGSRSGNSLEIRLEYEARGGVHTGNLLVHLCNTGEDSLETKIEDNSYGAKPAVQRLAAGQSKAVLLRLGASHQWYDFSVKASDSNSEARFAGRVETGRHGFTDPLMGGVASPS